MCSPSARSSRRRQQSSTAVVDVVGSEEDGSCGAGEVVAAGEEESSFIYAVQENQTGKLSLRAREPKSPSVSKTRRVVADGFERANGLQ